MILSDNLKIICFLYCGVNGVLYLCFITKTINTMNTKKYLHVTVVNHGGTTYTNHLKLSEAHFISQIAQENKSLTVRLAECTPKQYKFIFG